MRQAIQNILEDEGLEQLERIPVDYDELQEKAEEVEAEILQEARSQRKRVPVISDHTEAEAGLKGIAFAVTSIPCLESKSASSGCERPFFFLFSAIILPIERI